MNVMGFSASPAQAKRVYSVAQTEVWAGPIDDWWEVPRIPDLIVDLRGGKWGKVVAAPGFPELEVELKVVQVAWPDMGVLPLPRAWWEKLAEVVKGFSLVYIGCGAGMGRTGTALAILAHLHGVVPPSKGPVAWVREVYHPGAVETSGQRAYVARITGVDLEGEEEMGRRGAFEFWYEPFPSFPSSQGKGLRAQAAQKAQQVGKGKKEVSATRRLWEKLSPSVEALGLSAFVEGPLLVVEGKNDFVTIKEVTPHLWEVNGELMTPQEAVEVLRALAL